MSLQEKLIKENKNRWLDIGCGKNFEEGFYYVDTFLKKNIPPKYRKRYFKINILSASNKALKNIGKFDLVRMQHVLEHFSYEEGKIVIANIAKLLNKNGYIVITVPDLKINVYKYIKNEYKKWRAFKWWAIKRIPEDAPACFYFSVFAYSLPITPHKWCYDYEGVKYLLKCSGFFKNIRELKFSNPLASFPFTHNKPEEDVCIIANRI
jgi:predicted SAM-dependent methyltransferase